MEDLGTQFDLSKWSLEDKTKLLNAVLNEADGKQKSYRSSEANIKWSALSLQLDGKSKEECKTMYQKLTHKVRKFRTMTEVVTDALAVVGYDHKKASATEHSDLPKKPPTAFGLFVMKRSKKFPDMKGANRMKVFANDWNELSDGKKEYYKKKYMKMKQKYDAELETFRANHPDVIVPGAGAPQPPLPCRLFVESRLEKVKNKAPELSNTEAVKKLTNKYKTLSDKKKLKWINKAKDSFQAYQDQCEAYQLHNPKLNHKAPALHLSKEEQRIWNSFKGKPVTAPAKNIFLFFCTSQRDNYLHLNFSEQSRKLSTIYHQLSESQLKEVTDTYIQEVEDYIQSYKEYYQSLSEEERSAEKSPDEALAQYRKILENDQKKQRKKKKSHDKIPSPKKSKVPDAPQENHEAADSTSSTSLEEEEEEVVPSKRKVEVEAAPGTPHKKRKHNDDEPPADADDLLSMWSPLRAPAHSSEDQVTSTQPAATSKTPKKVKKQH